MPKGSNDAPRGYTDKERLEWLLKFAFTKQLGGASDAQDFVYTPIQSRFEIDQAIRRQTAKQ